MSQTVTRNLKYLRIPEWPTNLEEWLQERMCCPRACGTIIFPWGILWRPTGSAEIIGAGSMMYCGSEERWSKEQRQRSWHFSQLGGNEGSKSGKLGPVCLPWMSSLKIKQVLVVGKNGHRMVSRGMTSGGSQEALQLKTYSHNGNTDNKTYRRSICHSKKRGLGVCNIGRIAVIMYWITND